MNYYEIYVGGRDGYSIFFPSVKELKTYEDIIGYALDNSLIERYDIKGIEYADKRTEQEYLKAV